MFAFLLQKRTNTSRLEVSAMQRAKFYVLQVRLSLLGSDFRPNYLEINFCVFGEAKSNITFKTSVRAHLLRQLSSA